MKTLAKLFPTLIVALTTLSSCRHSNNSPTSVTDPCTPSPSHDTVYVVDTIYLPDANTKLPSKRYDPISRRHFIDWEHGSIVVNDDDFFFLFLDYITKPIRPGDKRSEAEDARNDSVFFTVCSASDGALSDVLYAYLFQALESKPMFLQRVSQNTEFEDRVIYIISVELYMSYDTNGPTPSEMFDKYVERFKKNFTPDELAYFLSLKEKILDKCNHYLREDHLI